MRDAERREECRAMNGLQGNPFPQRRYSLRARMIYLPVISLTLPVMH